MICVVALAWTMLFGLTAASDLDAEATETVPFVELVLKDQGVVQGYPFPTENDSDRLILQGTQLWSGDQDQVKSWRVIEQHPVDRMSPVGLAAGLDQPDAITREAAFEWLLERGPEISTSLAVPLKSRRPETRVLALRLFDRFPDRRLRRRVVACLWDQDPMVRRHALVAYARLEPLDLVSRCETVLTRRDDPIVAHQAINLLGLHATVESVDLLLEHLAETTDRSVQMVTFVALRKITGQNFGRNEAGWRSWWSNHREEVLEQGSS